MIDKNLILLADFRYTSEYSSFKRIQVGNIGEAYLFLQFLHFRQST